MDGMLVATVVATSVTTAATFGAGVIAAVRYYVGAEIDRKLSKQADDILTRVNGTYMRGPEQRSINEGLADELREVRQRVDRMHTDVAALSTNLHVWRRSET